MLKVENEKKLKILSKHNCAAHMDLGYRSKKWKAAKGQSKQNILDSILILPIMKLTTDRKEGAMIPKRLTNVPGRLRSTNHCDENGKLIFSLFNRTRKQNRTRDHRFPEV